MKQMLLTSMLIGCCLLSSAQTAETPEPNVYEMLPMSDIPELADMLKTGQLRVKETRPAEGNDSTTLSLSISLQKAGTLADSLGANLLKVDTLILEGPLNADDFNTMWRASFDGRLVMIDMKNSSPEDGKIPEGAFFHPGKQVSDGFIYLIKLKDIRLPHNLMEIGRSAFNFAGNLRTVEMPPVLQKFGLYSFAECTHLEMPTLFIPCGVTEIPGMCFYNCKGIKKVHLPQSVKRIGEGAFFSSGITEINLHEEINYIGNVAFRATDLKNVVIPPSCTTFDRDGQFSQCRSLRSIKIEAPLTAIPASFLNECESLTEVSLPSTIESIGHEAFLFCSALKEITLPEGLRTIDYKAFCYAESLKSLVLPASVTELKENCFSEASGLEFICSKSAIPPVCAQPKTGKPEFWSVPNNIPVYVPVGTSGIYKEKYGWNYFTNYIETDTFPTSGVTDIEAEETVDDGCCYDLMGNRLTNPAPGTIYIRNGKKYIGK